MRLLQSIYIKNLEVHLSFVTKCIKMVVTIALCKGLQRKVYLTILKYFKGTSCRKLTVEEIKVSQMQIFELCLKPL